jgi:hypothetical protein
MRIRWLALVIVLAAAPAHAGELNGHWRHGNWLDTNSGHEGPLRARFRQVDDDHYRAVFSGRFRQVIPFRFATTLNVVGRDGDQVYMAGEPRVALFWKFRYTAVADAHHFHADYDSRRWKGEFNLSR